MRSFNTTDSVTNPASLLGYYLFLSQNNSPENILLGKQMINDWHKKLLQKYFFNERSYSIQTVGNKQEYPLPFDYSKLKTGTVTVGNLRWNPTEILSRREWDDLNVFPYYADIPSNFYIYGGKFNLWPIPSTGSTLVTYTALAGTLVVGNTITQGVNTGIILTVDVAALTMRIAVTLGSVFAAGAFTTSNGATGTIVTASITAGNIITFNYQKRVPDMTFTDYVTGTVAATNNNIHLVGTGTAWLTTFTPTAGNVEHLNLWVRITSPAGDGEWYQIQSIETNTTLTLLQPYQGNNVAGAAYAIGQMPFLLEDFHDVVVWGPLVTYFSTIQENQVKLTEFRNKMQESLSMMDEYVGTKSLNVNLAQRINTINPNLFQQDLG